MNQCYKQTTVAIIMKDKKFISIGFNNTFHNMSGCPRDAQNMKTGEGYELCESICKQTGHAEVNACKNAGTDANGATLYLIGHTYCCDNCKRVMEEHGIKNVIIVKE